MGAYYSIISVQKAQCHLKNINDCYSIGQTFINLLVSHPNIYTGVYLHKAQQGVSPPPPKRTIHRKHALGHAVMSIHLKCFLGGFGNTSIMLLISLSHFA